MNVQELNTASLREFVQDHLQEDPAQLLFKYDGKTDFDLKFAVQQIAARQKARHKLPQWTGHEGLLFPVSLSMEQCSSELTAEYKRKFLSGKSMIDLTGGFGVDTYYLSKNFREAIYIERDDSLSQLAIHNFIQLAPGKINVHQGDSIAFLQSSTTKYDWLYVDPARRGDHNQKLYKLSDCEPDIVFHWALLKASAENIMIKASPMLDVKAVLAELPDVEEVVVLSIKNEVKEVLLLFRKGVAREFPLISCVNLSEGNEEVFNFDYEEESVLEPMIGPVEDYLIEPYAPILKAGGFKSFAHQFLLNKIHPHSHLYTASSLPEKVPGRVFSIISELKPDKKTLSKVFQSGKVNIIVRNHPLKPEAIKKKFRLKDGGEDFLIATTTGEGKARFFHCSRIN